MNEIYEETVSVGIKDRLVIDTLLFINNHCPTDNDVLVHALLVSMVAEELIGLEEVERTRGDLKEAADRIIASVVGE